MTVSDGQKANAATLNGAFVSRTGDDNKSGKLTLDDADTATIDQVQRELNSQASFSGQNINQPETDKPSWASDSIGIANQSVKDRIDSVQSVVETNTTGISDNASDIADIRTTTGTSDGDTNMGSYTGSLLNANESTKQNIQQLSDAVENIPSGLAFQGNWNADTNTPTLVSSTGTSGHYYIVSVAGTTNLDGVSDWGVGDWAVFTDTGVWQKLDNSDVVVSVNGQSGAVVLDTDDIAEGVTNEYYTNAKADARIAAASIDDLSDVDTTTSAPSVSQALVWDGVNWAPADQSGGSGQGLRNFVAQVNSDFETDVIGDTDWITFNDGAVTAPVDGEGAGSTLTFDLTTVAGEVLEGTKSLEVNKTAANSQGMGISLNLQDIDLAFQGDLGFGSFAYNTSDANYSDTWGVWLYDRDAASIINITEESNLVPSGIGRFDFTFNIPTNGINVSQTRLILMETGTNTNAYDLFFDIFTVGPDALSRQIPVATEGEAYTPTISGFGTVTDVDFQYVLVGSRCLVEGYFEPGTPAASLGTITLPNGYTVKDQGFPVDTEKNVGVWIKDISSNPSEKTSNMLGSADSNLIYFASSRTDGAQSPFTRQNGNFVGSSGVGFYIKIDVEINESPLSPSAIVATNKVVRLFEEQAANTTGGANVVGTQDRTLNSLDDDFSIVSSLGSNLFRFSTPGKYYIDASAPAYSVNRHKVQLALADNTIVLDGTSEYADSSNFVANRSHVRGYFTVTDPAQDYKIRHYTQTVNAKGLGHEVNNGLEKYTEVQIWKVEG